MTEPTRPFDRCNLFELCLAPMVAHDGEGQILFRRIATPPAVSKACHFIDFTSMPPGTTIGEHTHSETEEEYYLILRGHGLLWRDGERIPLRAGDLVRNRPGGTHTLRNTGSTPLQMVVFEVAA